MKLKIRDMEAEHDKVAEKDYLDLLDITAEVNEEEENPLFQWVRPVHLDDEHGNPDPRIAAHAREAGINVERVLSEEVHTESFSKDTEDTVMQGGMSQPAVTSRPSFDSTSIEQSSRPSGAGTSASGYDGSRGDGTNDGDDDGGDIGQQQHQSQPPLSPFTCEDDFTHCTQDQDHGSRRAGPGVGAIGKPYRGRQRTMTPYNEDSFSASFESMSIGTQFSDSSHETNIYPPYTMDSMGYGQSEEEYGMFNYPPPTQIPYNIPYQMQGGQQMSIQENSGFPIHGEVVGSSQQVYEWHVRTYNQYYRNSISWYEYCLQQDGLPSFNNAMEPHRSSFWY